MTPKMLQTAVKVQKRTRHPVERSRNFFSQKIRHKPRNRDKMFTNRTGGKAHAVRGNSQDGCGGTKTDSVRSVWAPDRTAWSRRVSARVSVPGLAPSLAAVFPSSSRRVGQREAKTAMALLFPDDSGLSPVDKGTD